MLAKRASDGAYNVLCRNYTWDSIGKHVERIVTGENTAAMMTISEAPDDGVCSTTKEPPQ